MRQFADVFKTWGAQGGKTRAKRLTPARRREIAKRAAETRWKKKTTNSNGK